MSTLKVDTLDTSNGTGNITLSRPIVGDGSNLTGISPSKAAVEALGIELPAANLTGTLPALDGSNLTGVAPTKAAVEALGIDLPAANLTGTIAAARIPENAVTQHVQATDLTAVHQSIATLGLHMGVSANAAAFNLPNAFIDTFEDDSGIATETTVDRVTDGEYVASVYVSMISTTPSSASDYTGDTGSFTITSGGLDNTAGDDSIRSNWTATGDFIIQLTMTNRNNAGFGVYAISEDATFASTNVCGMNAMTNSFWWHDKQNSNGSKVSKGGTAEGSFTKPADGSVMIIRRVGTTITFEDDGVVLHTWASGVDSEIRFAHGNSGTPYDGDYDNITFSAETAADNATGTLISDTQTAPAATTEVSGVILYKDNAGTATLGTELKIYFTANNGTNWTEAASYETAQTFSGTTKQVKLGKTTVTSGTQVAMKAVWASQVSNSMETQLHGWAVNY